MSEEDEGRPLELVDAEDSKRCGSEADLAIERYKIYIAYIRHENELIHQRAGRFIGIQAALIATVGLVLQKYFEIVSLYEEIADARVAPVYFFLLCVSIVGLISARAALISLRGARDAQRATYKAYADLGFGATAHALGLPALMGGGLETPTPAIPESDRRGSNFLIYLPITLFTLWCVTAFWLFLFQVAPIAKPSIVNVIFAR